MSPVTGGPDSGCGPRWNGCGPEGMTFIPRGSIRTPRETPRLKHGVISKKSGGRKPASWTHLMTTALAAGSARPGLPTVSGAQSTLLGRVDLSSTSLPETGGPLGRTPTKVGALVIRTALDDPSRGWVAAVTARRPSEFKDLYPDGYAYDVRFLGPSREARFRTVPAGVAWFGRGVRGRGLSMKFMQPLPQRRGTWWDCLHTRLLLAGG